MGEDEMRMSELNKILVKKDVRHSYTCLVCGKDYDLRSKARDCVRYNHTKMWKLSNKFKSRDTKRNGLMKFIKRVRLE